MSSFNITNPTQRACITARLKVRTCCSLILKTKPNSVSSHQKGVLAKAAQLRVVQRQSIYSWKLPANKFLHINSLHLRWELLSSTQITIYISICLGFLLLPAKNVSLGVKNIHKSVAEVHFKYENLHCSGFGVLLQRVKTFTFVQARIARNPV